MEQELPSSMDNSFWAAILQSEQDNEAQITIVRFSAHPAVESGNNYTSHLFRVRVEYRVAEADKSMSFIVKIPISKGVILDITDADFFSKEPKIYSDLLPNMNEKFHHEFGPKYFLCAIKDALVLKDMAGEGYFMCDRTKQLDYSHCKKVFETIARFHAASVSCYHDNPDLIKAISKESIYFDGGLYEKEVRPWFSKTMEITAGVIEEMNLCKKFSELLLSRADKIWDSVVKLCKPKLKGLNVLNHGDMWTANMLFKYNDAGEVSEVKFIDYQVCRYTTPVADLFYFTWTSANEDVRENSLRELYDLYLQTLNISLKQLGCEERLSREELEEDIKSASDWTLYLICNSLPLMVCEKENAVNIKDMNMDELHIDANSDADYLKMYKGKNYRGLLPKLVKQIQIWNTYS